MAETFKIDTRYNRVVGILSIPKNGKEYPCVILCHGLISSKESSKYLALSEELNGAGIATCRFDFHGCGESGGNIEETTLTIRVENLDAVVEYVLSHTCIDRERIGILGSSFGGSTCIVKGAGDERVKCISLWATPHKLEKEDDGRISGVQFNESIYSDFATYDLLGEAKKLSRTLVIHGELDEVVPCTEGKAIYDRIKKPKKLEIIKGADHVFSNLPHRERANSLSLNWFRRYFLGR
jgi:dipeptidyl aminopeptidase/acylaminoacyl peptidase